MVVNLMPYKLVSAGLSDIGLVRQNNEDVWAQLPQIGFFALADGMGGHQAGEIAAREAVDILSRIVEKKIAAKKDQLSLIELKELLFRAIVNVNAIVYKMSRAKVDCRGMGTTLCCLLYHPEGVVIAHVGDSRIYRLRHQKLLQLTKDHSLLRELIDHGQINEQQATDFLYKNIITKAIGTEPKVEPSVDAEELEEGDIYLMCSDGLSDLLTTNDIESILLSFPSIDQATEVLVATANQRGGRDNITVVLVKIIGSDALKDLSRQ